MKNSLKKILAAGVLATAASTSHAATVDLMVVYDSYTSNYFKGDVNTAIRNWVSQVNTMFVNSQVDVQLRLVGAYAHEETGSNMTEVLGNLRVDSWVNQKRQEVGADYVTQLHRTGSCGVAYVAVDRNWSYGVVGPSCGPTTMAHELGHTMGLNHSRRQGDQSGSRYRYGVGHGVDGVFGTIMTYEWLFNAPKVPKFSNPNLQCNGLPCGVAAGYSTEADAARAINNVRTEMAGFMPTKVGGGNPDGGDNNNGGDNNGASNIYTMKAKNSGKCADVYGGDRRDGASVIQWSCHGGNNQRWQFIHLGNGVHQIKSVNSGKCLDLFGASQYNGAYAGQWTCNNSNNQKWQAFKNTDGTYRLIAVHSGKALDVDAAGGTYNGARLRQWDWVGANNQRWIITSAGQ
ncbi:protein containing QXW lectin repeats [Hahella chejuensis KCTC 2396]|uniref:Protein containing QXW lectin repeats n=1 Tax=Hahella chejuensis (strain KCTC 2396) TaxID=349521 RepID=Q2SDY1_HAHCH|nr:RICIN domain-containing protein [Hahella chejuensis]ABC31143.1 protein containing QXW lectin repeats [Hahella chejuensis KCTC 2396]